MTIDEFCKKTGWAEKCHLEYWMAIRKIINPSGDKKVGVQPCSGADALSFFLITDAKLAYFIDGLRFGSEEQSRNARFKPDITEEEYWLHTSFGGGMGGGFTWSSVLAATKLLRTPLCWELAAMRATEITIEEIEGNVHQIDFDWEYWGEKEAKHRRILFFSHTDTRNPRQYPQRLKDLLKEGVDFYFEKAARDSFALYNAPFDGDSRWREFTSIAKFNPGSILVASHRPETGIEGFEEINSDYLHLLEKRGAKFGVWTALLWRKI